MLLYTEQERMSRVHSNTLIIASGKGLISKLKRNKLKLESEVKSAVVYRA